MTLKKNAKFASATLIAFAIIAYYASIRVYSVHGNRIVSVHINNNELYGEIVSSDEKLKTGLGRRNDLCSSCGMIFKFQKVGIYSFWMKEMKFPIDLIWFFQGKIVHMEKNVMPSFAGVLTPAVDADTVLEINAGKIDELGIKIGDSISF